MEFLHAVLFAIIVGMITTLILCKIYQLFAIEWCRCTTALTGKTVIVTGANTGIGFYTAMDLARRNARVILACRSMQRGQAAVDKIMAATNNQNVVVKQLDLCSLESVRNFVKTFMAEESRLDILINNAGILRATEDRTEDGLEKVAATNHFGPFLLTNLLLDILKRSAPSRVVNVSSVAHTWIDTLDFDLLQGKADYNMQYAYRNSKLANVLFTKELAEHLAKSGVTTYSLHPGYIETDIWRNVSWTYSIMIAIPRFLFFKSSEAGAQTSIYCAISQTLAKKSGGYYVDCQEAECSPAAMDKGVAKKLWEVSEKLTGLS